MGFNSAFKGLNLVSCCTFFKLLRYCNCFDALHTAQCHHLLPHSRTYCTFYCAGRSGGEARGFHYVLTRFSHGGIKYYC